MVITIFYYMLPLFFCSFLFLSNWTFCVSIHINFLLLMHVFLLLFYPDFMLVLFCPYIFPCTRFGFVLFSWYVTLGLVFIGQRCRLDLVFIGLVWLWLNVENRKKLNLLRYCVVGPSEKKCTTLTSGCDWCRPLRELDLNEPPRLQHHADTSPRLSQRM